MKYIIKQIKSNIIMRILALVLIVGIISCTQIEWPKQQLCDPKWVGKIFKNPQDCSSARGTIEQYTHLSSCMTKWGKTVEGKPATPDAVINFMRRNGGDECFLALRTLGVQGFSRQKLDEEFVQQKMAKEESCVLLMEQGQDKSWYLVNVAEGTTYEAFSTRGEKKVIKFDTYPFAYVYEKYINNLYDIL